MSRLSHLQYDSPEISVVIPAYNEERYLARTLEALARNAPNMQTEIIVVDNASTDDTPRIAQSFGAKVIHEGTKGVSYARQTGLDSAKGNIILWTDADSSVHPDWIRAHAEGFTESSVVAQKGPVTYDETIHWSFTTYQAVANLVKRIIGYEVLLPLGPNMAFRKEAALSVGGFEPGSDLGEDQIIYGKLEQIGNVIHRDDPRLMVVTSGRRWSSSAKTAIHIRNIVRRFKRVGIAEGVSGLERIQPGMGFQDFR